MELSIIFVNWNSADYLRDCLASIHAYTKGVEFEIIVVDNASADAAPGAGLDALQARFPEMKIIRSPENLGFAKANNLGFQQASGRYLLFLNPDTQLRGPSINILLERLKALPDAGVVGCKLLNSDLSVQLSSIQKFPTILNQALDAEYLLLRWPHCPLWELAPLFSADGKMAKVDAISGACMFLRREVFEKIGLFSEDYFMYVEDLDLNYKAKRAGFVNYYFGDTTIIHHGGRSSSRQKVSQWAIIMKHNAVLRLFYKTHGAVYAGAYRAAMGSVATGRLALLALMFPLRGIVWDRGSMQFAREKWTAVLNWALGRQALALGERS